MSIRLLRGTGGYSGPAVQQVFAYRTSEVDGIQEDPVAYEVNPGDYQLLLSSPKTDHKLHSR